MLKSRIVKVRAYTSISGLKEILSDARYLLRRSFLGLPRVEISDLFDLESEDFELAIPNRTHDGIRNASLGLNDKVALAMLCRCLKPKKVVEIGTFRGETTDLIARNCADCDIYTLDLPPDFRAHTYQADPDDLEVLRLRQNHLYIQPSRYTNSRIH